MSLANTTYMIGALFLIGFGIKILFTGYVTLGVEGTSRGTSIRGMVAKALGILVVIGGVILAYLAATGAADTVFTQTR